MLTVVDELGNDGPRWWQEAAKVVVCEIKRSHPTSTSSHAGNFDVCVSHLSRLDSVEGEGRAGFDNRSSVKSFYVD